MEANSNARADNVDIDELVFYSFDVSVQNIEKITDTIFLDVGLARETCSSAATLFALASFEGYPTLERTTGPFFAQSRDNALRR